jgi:hypothetical protein
MVLLQLLFCLRLDEQSAVTCNDLKIFDNYNVFLLFITVQL